MIRRLALALSLSLFATSAWAMNAPPSPPPFSVLMGDVTLNVTATSSRAALPSTNVNATAITISNSESGAKDVFVKLGDATVVATTSDIPVRAGQKITIYVGSNTYIAAIAGAGNSATLDVYQGNGPF